MTNTKLNKVSNIALVHDWFSSKHFGGAEKTLFIIDKLLSKDKGNFQEIFSNTVAKVGSNVQTNKLSLTAAEANKDASEAALSEFSGVSLDDEAAHLLEFQQAYQASARLLQTARELFQSLIEVV